MFSVETGEAPRGRVFLCSTRSPACALASSSKPATASALTPMTGMLGRWRRDGARRSGGRRTCRAVLVLSQPNALRLDSDMIST